MEELRTRTVLDREGLDRGLDALAVRLRKRLPGGDFTVIAVLRGALVFAADLVRRLEPGLLLDFLRIQTYGDGRSPGCPARVDWRPDPSGVRGRRVLLLDDIADTGRTLAEARRVLLEEMGAADVVSVVLVDKRFRREGAIRPDDSVLRLEEDVFLVGYGLDHRGRYRNLPELRALDSVAGGEPAPLAVPAPHGRG